MSCAPASPRHYLDANASEPLRPEARAAMLAAMDLTGNPSSVHSEGRAARRMLEDAREAVAGRFGARPAGVVFTSGATEANALALHALGASRRVIVSAIEHDSLRVGNSLVLPVDREGQAELGALEETLASAGAALLCLMLANNETGVIQPVARAAELCRRHGALLHVDAVQAAGRIAVSLPDLGAHSLSVSGHKLGGPPGAGALILGPEIAAPLPLVAGGGQERGWRGGTPALPAIAGFAAALAAAESAEPLVRLRDAIEETARAVGAGIAGAAAPRLPNTSCLVLDGVRADAQVMALDLAGISVSAGAACSSGKVAASHVLAAMGFGARAGEAIRVSLPWNACWSGVRAFAGAYPAMVERLRAASLPPALPPLATRAA